MKTVVSYYGIEIKRNDTCCCPFHNDKHPSAKLYSKAFHCFTCNIHYDIIGFVVEYLGLNSQYEGLQRLNEDFHLGFEFRKSKMTSNQRIYNEQSEILSIKKRNSKMFDEWEEKSWQTLHNYLWFMRSWYEKYKPKSESDSIDNKFHIAVKEFPTAESLSMDWIEMTNDEKLLWKNQIHQMQIFLDKYKEKPESTENPCT